MSTAARAKKSELTEVELFTQRFGHLKEFKSTSGGRNGWAGVAMSIQSKTTQRLKVSAVIWIDHATCEKYGIDVKRPGLRFNIYNDGKDVMVETVPPGSNQGVKAILHPHSICVNWHSVPDTIRRDTQPPTSVEGFQGITVNGAVQIGFPLPVWFFGSKEGGAE